MSNHGDMHSLKGNTSSGGFSQNLAYQPNIKFYLNHLSLLMGENIANYSSRFEPSSTLSANSGYVCCSIPESSMMLVNRKYVLYAIPPSEEVTAKWSTAFIALPPFQNLMYRNYYQQPFGDLYGAVNKTNAKREASLKREREESGKFKRCKTKWVPVTEFYKDTEAAESANIETQPNDNEASPSMYNDKQNPPTDDDSTQPNSS